MQRGGPGRGKQQGQEGLYGWVFTNSFIEFTALHDQVFDMIAEEWGIVPQNVGHLRLGEWGLAAALGGVGNHGCGIVHTCM